MMSLDNHLSQHIAEAAKAVDESLQVYLMQKGRLAGLQNLATQFAKAAQSSQTTQGEAHSDSTPAVEASPPQPAAPVDEPSSSTVAQIAHTIETIAHSIGGVATAAASAGIPFANVVGAAASAIEHVADLADGD